ncbi:MAG TPA: DivIVA domain-containing protein [Microcella sp.]|nr:DivIVA domain-containing protein [Microcella sp.]
MSTDSALRRRARQNSDVPSTFPLASRGEPGYDTHQVDQFLSAARTAYADDADTSLTSDEIRRTAFRVVRRRGYAADQVDAALERLEEAFAARERERAIAAQGEAAFYAEVRAAAQEIVDRLARPDRSRFRRVGPLTRGYRTDDVDALCDRLAGYFQRGDAVAVHTVRSIAFRPRFGGYDEAQVDFVLDTVIRVMLAVR